MDKEKTKKTNSKKLQGVVVSNKMEHTLIVRVDRLVQHPKYKKRYTVSKRYMVHYNDGEYALGDKVEIKEIKPLSKNKKWEIIKKT